MPSIITDDGDIKVFGDSLTVSPHMNPKPSAGIQVLFSFRFIEHDQNRRIGGTATLGNYVADTLTAAPDAHLFDDLPKGLTGMTDRNQEYVEHLRGLMSNRPMDLDLGELVAMMLDKDYADLEHLLLVELNKRFFDSFNITAEIVPGDRVVGLIVTFSRADLNGYSFRFEMTHDVARHLFTIGKPAILEAAI
jgi:hypothetical protein